MTNTKVKKAKQYDMDKQHKQTTNTSRKATTNRDQAPHEEEEETSGHSPSGAFCPRTSTKCESDRSGPNEKSNTTARTDNLIQQPNDNDILIDRGKPYQNHPGNIKMRRLVEVYREKYNSADRDLRNVIALDLMGVLVEGGGRFLKRSLSDAVNPGNGASDFWRDGFWVVASQDEACEKLCRALRLRSGYRGCCRGDSVGRVKSSVVAECRDSSESMRSGASVGVAVSARGGQSTSVSSSDGRYEVPNSALCGDVVSLGASPGSGVTERLGDVEFRVGLQSQFEMSSGLSLALRERFLRDTFPVEAGVGGGLGLSGRMDVVGSSSSGLGSYPSRQVASNVLMQASGGETQSVLPVGSGSVDISSILGLLASELGGPGRLDVNRRWV